MASHASPQGSSRLVPATSRGGHPGWTAPDRVCRPDNDAPEIRSFVHTKPRARRVVWVDLLRLLASFQMIHGHTLDALLSEELRHGVAFARWSWCRGLVSVSFMVAAGVAFSLSTLDRFDAHRADAALKRRRLVRFFWLVVLGYLLHFPAGILSGGELARASLVEFQMVDVLQCIGVSLLLLQLLTWTLRTRQQVLWVASGLSLFFLVAAPLADSVSVTGPLPRFFANYLTHRGGSLFPLFPWAGFVLAGVALAGIALPKGTATPHAVALPRLALVAAAVLAVAALLRALGLDSDAVSYQARTWFAFSKLGWVLVVVTALAVVAVRFRRLPRPLQILSGESLTLYVFHLMILYGAGVGLYHSVGRTLSLPAAITVAAAMVVVSAAVALGWHRLKKTGWVPRI